MVRRSKQEMEELRINSGIPVARISIIVSKRVRKRKKATKRLECNSERVQNFISSMPYHAVFGFLIPLLTEIVDVNFQGKTESLFETHPAIMWVFLVSTFIYSFAFAADLKTQLQHKSYSQLFPAVALISGSLSSVTLIYIFLPPSHRHIIFIAWTLVPLIVAYQHALLIKNGYNRLHEKIKKNTILNFSCFEENKLTEQQRVPV